MARDPCRLVVADVLGDRALQDDESREFYCVVKIRALKSMGSDEICEKCKSGVIKFLQTTTNTGSLIANVDKCCEDCIRTGLSMLRRDERYL
ncbi:unnamed protein product [Bursaphelenchus xylophilus]|uniref:(pine wood nematode) hypothetical protein n=1 Tax=Bursaphelenchus xylophilus TaxID=6326 RepID=A0A7I8WMP7_BURXY|nr:unnamed protein product [Bursaphelenchus xylophilus]CAG9092209.1 unnamed protein product [Bursaphelenchus xylophilus]